MIQFEAESKAAVKYKTDSSLSNNNQYKHPNSVRTEKNYKKSEQNKYSKNTIKEYLFRRKKTSTFRILWSLHD